MGLAKKKLSENQGLIHKIAVLSKDYYTITTTDNLFIFAGADPSWWQDPTQGADLSSQRMHNTYGWIEGIRGNAPDQMDIILEGVALQMIENTTIDQGDRDFLQRQLGIKTSPVVQTYQLTEAVTIPHNIETLLDYLIKGLPRAMFPLKFRRKGLPYLDFENEYDVQSLLHALLRPWIKDIRPEEYTPSYAGSSTRIDFLLPTYGIVCEVKIVRDKLHAAKIGDELIIDIAHYKVHPQCKELLIVIYDPKSLVQNPGGLQNDLQRHTEQILVKTYIL